jgi:hypothetical protein
MAIVTSVEGILGCFIHMIRMISCNLREYNFFFFFVSRRKVRVFGQWVLPQQYILLVGMSSMAPPAWHWEIGKRKTVKANYKKI